MNQLPNVFHDAKLKSLNIDYEKMELQATIHFWVGGMDKPVGPEREKYMRAQVNFTGLQFCVLDAPSHGYSLTPASPKHKRFGYHWTNPHPPKGNEPEKIPGVAF